MSWRGVVILSSLSLLGPSMSFHACGTWNGKREPLPEWNLPSHSGTVAAPGFPADLMKPTWDAAAGVWVGDRAAACDEDIPLPLWIFGKRCLRSSVTALEATTMTWYGSLCWKPERSLEGFETLDGAIVGWKRLFAQKNMDHRGTPGFPGLVATVVSDADLEEKGLWSSGDSPSKTHGVAYRVPDDKVEEVLARLDFRERGGYTRAVVDVYPIDGSGTGVSVEEKNDRPSSETPMRALLYTGSVDNPNFFLANSMEEAATMIASAAGPSGPNYEYLFSLGDFLEEVGHPDSHVTELVELVRSRMRDGPGESRNEPFSS